MKFRSRSGQGQAKKGQILKLIVLHKMGIDSMQLVTGESNGGLCFALRGLELLKIEFENLTSSILNSFFAITWPKKRGIDLKFGM